MERAVKRLAFAMIGGVIAAVLPGSGFQIPGSVRAIVSRADRIHTKPVTRREDGIPIGNGRIGARVWMSDRALNLQIDRVDIEPIELDLAGSGGDVFAMDGTHQRLSVYEGLLDMKAAGVNLRMLAWPARDVIAIEVEDRRTAPEPIQINLRKRRSALQLVTRDGRIVLTQDMEAGAHTAQSAIAIALLGRRTLTRLAGESEARITSPAERGRVVILIASAATLGARQDVGAAALGNLDAAAAKSFDDLAGDTAEWWHDFWQRSASAMTSDTHHYDLYLNAASGSAVHP
jgi:hypothetical protein